MVKVICALAIVTTLCAQTAFPRGRGCCCNSYSAAPVHVEEKAPAAPAAPEAKSTAPAPQASAPSQNRSFSIEPSTSANTAPVYRTYRYSMPRIDGSYGIRPAGDKLIGNY